MSHMTLLFQAQLMELIELSILSWNEEKPCLFGLKIVPWLCTECPRESCIQNGDTQFQNYSPTELFIGALKKMQQLLS